MKQQDKQQKGFTIIEVVLVLAIAGLIFLIVFLAVPALQRSQRDTQRRNDVSRMMSQVSQYQSNNQGQVPGSKSGSSASNQLSDFVDRYLTTSSDQFSDPTTGDPYDVQIGNGTTKPASDAYGTIFYYMNTRCNGEDVEAGAGGRNVAVVTPLEGGAYFCQDNT